MKREHETMLATIIALSIYVNEVVWGQLEKTENFGVKFCWLHSFQVVFLTSIRCLKTYWRVIRRYLVHRDLTAKNISLSLLYSRHISLQKQLEMAVTLFQLTLLGKTLWVALPLYSYNKTIRKSRDGGQPGQQALTSWTKFAQTIIIIIVIAIIWSYC